MAERGAGGKWLPGKSANPGGRIAVTDEQKDFAIACRSHCPAALELLVSAVKDKKAKMSDRIKAATVLIERGYGKAPQELELTVGAEGPGLIVNVITKKPDIVIGDKKG